MQRIVRGPVLLAAACAAPVVRAAYFVSAGHESPVDKVVELLGELKSKIESEGKDEQASYDKFACWCEEALGKKATEITENKDSIEELQQTILKLKGELGSHGADIEQLKKDIGKNLAAQKEASQIRSKERSSYSEGRNEAEQCIGALEAAINVLTNAGTGKKGFLETLQQAKLLSVAAGVRGVLARKSFDKSMSADDLEVIKFFVEKPEDFTGASQPAMSAAQIANNPFGDYAPQSTRVQGVLKSMYDSFTSDLERSNGEEAVKQKAYEELMETKRSELKTLEETLQTHEMDEAEKTKTLAESNTQRDDTKAQVEADETFFASSKEACRLKAGEWAERSRLRTEELAGIGKAVEILSDPETQKNFENATTTFLQMASRRGGSRDKVKAAYTKLRSLATQYKNMGLAKLALAVKAGGHFDKVMAAIDTMISTLRDEEKEDIAHKDRCQGSQNKNKNDLEDLEYAIEKATKEIERLEGQAQEKTNKIEGLSGAINTTKEEMGQIKEQREQEHTEFLQAIAADAKAIEKLNEAITVLSKLSRQNGLDMKLLQKHNQTTKAKEPEYADAPPETKWATGSKYEGKSGTGGIVSILAMIKEDLEKETKTASQSDIDAQVEYEKNRKAMQDMLNAQKATMATLERELADLRVKIADQEEHKELKSKDKESEEEEKTALETDCAWVESHFDSRREKRKAEINGLMEAKNYLAGVDSGESLDFD
eukprot:TRINITY_DN79_c2_g1_i1.p1 TRINITY_DN79_c2_g1~~TRINITY_DN79_c2_g1_i1.p1  ORF type:complete len:716 (+),score=317.70 TRINITY_DN79_c2_g1_i1:85-2232(+)